ncbi:MAG: hypothetical protein U9Q12_03605 [Patescibacteria group bacterium]|nr:hypothetical protein [Patescibacteria group bacterium]
MELREFFAIFGVHKKLFWGIIGLFVIGSLIFYFLQEQTYKTYVNINITRSGVDETFEYTYDSFYRLQADSKFADTVVEWMKTPYVLEQIFDNGSDGAINQKGFLHADRMSSQTIAVTFVTATKKEAQNIAKNLNRTLNEETQKLNKIQKQENWFVIFSNDPITGDNRLSLFFVLTVGFAIGLFISFWAVMIKHYIVNSKQ